MQTLCHLTPVVVDKMRRPKRKTSAQVLILAAIAIALILVSTEVYVFQLSQDSLSENLSSPNDFATNVKLSSRNLLIGLVSNISKDKDDQILEPALERWIAFIIDNYYLGECTARFELCENGSYSSGLRMDWGQDGFGITSASVGFQMNLTGDKGDVAVYYSVNTTTSLSVYSSSVSLNANRRLVNVRSDVSNEGGPALARNLVVHYKGLGDWSDASLSEAYRQDDFGNGTYQASFILEDLVTEVSVICCDSRDILVQTNATCRED